MFDDWKRAWRQAVENFQREVRESPPGAPLRVKAMERELTSAGGALSKLEHEILRTRREAEKEREAAVVARRREALARKAGDEETERIALDFATRHDERADLLERKAGVLEEEKTLLGRDVEQMRRVLNEAMPAADALREAAEPSQKSVDDHAFHRMEHEVRERAADARLEELKRRMRG